MKKRAIFAMFLSMTAIMYAGTPISASSLPAAAQTFLNKHFAGDNVRKAEKDNGRRGTEYEVDMTSGAEIEFTSDGDWKEIKASRGNAVPAAVVPAAIAKFVADNFSGEIITEIAKKRGGYEVELSNGTELKLTADAKPMPQRNGNGNRGGRPRTR